MGICCRCYSSNVSVTLIEGQCYCKNCEQNRAEENLNK